MPADIYPHPVSMVEVLRNRALRSLLPTGMDSEMLAQLPRAVRERAMFSAGVQNTDFLSRAADAVNRITSGQTNIATERTALRQLAQSLDMDEIAKDSRINLILDTQTRMASGYGAWIEGQHPSVLDMWPAQEFYRAEERKEPRDWPARWEAAGGTFYPGESDYPDGRMIALKDNPIWVEISAFGYPYAPFDYNSGMDLEDVSHDEAVELGIIDDDYLPTPQNLGLNDGLEASIGDLAGKFGLDVALGEILGNLVKITLGGNVLFTGI
jgi:hypothetical protein